MRALVSERTGGVSAPPFASLNLGTAVGDDPECVAENLRRVERALGLGGAVARAGLVHGAGVALVDRPGRIPDTDALVTRNPVALALTIADCFPLAVAAGPWRGLAHCGWRGVAAGIVQAMLDRLGRLGAPMEEARAWIGPGIGACCYQVGPEVAERFPESLVPGATLRLDLEAEISRRLEAGGLAPPRIAAARLCTSCHVERFYSHRREGRTGRMAAYLFSNTDS